MANSTRISLFEVLWHLLASMSFHKTLDILKNKYKKEHIYFYYIGFNMFYFVPYPRIKKLHIFTSQETVKRVLSKQKANLTYFNRIFNCATGLKYTINNINASDAIFKQLHGSLKKSLWSIAQGDKYLNLFDESLNNMKYCEDVCLNDVIEDVVLNFWAKVIFGENMDIAVYNDIRKNIISLLGYTFYNTSTQKIPIVGHINSTIRHHIKRHEFNNIRVLIKETINLHQNGFAYELYKNLDLDDELKWNLVIDNIFLSFLVYDFIYNLFHHMTISKIRMSKVDFNNSLKQNKVGELCDFIKNNLVSSFLYPVRMRIVDDTDSELNISSGDTCIIDLIDAELYFSFGMRGCVGYPLIKQIAPRFMAHLAKFHIKFNDDSVVKINPNKDMPFVQSRNNVMIVPIIVSNIIGSSSITLHNNSIPFYDVLSICSNLTLRSMAKKVIMDNVNMNNISLIIGTETRGIPFASFVSEYLDKPIQLLIVRKDGSYKLDVYKQIYKRGYNDDDKIIEIPKMYGELINNKKICIVDDGIASAGTLMATIKLLENFKSTGIDYEIVQIIAFLKHTYCKDEDMDQEYISNYMNKTLCVYST